MKATNITSTTENPTEQHKSLRFWPTTIAFSILSFQSPVWGMPQYALREHKQCVYCHYAEKGGGPTNAAGRYFAEHLSLEGYRDKRTKKAKKLKIKRPSTPNQEVLPADKSP